MTDGHMRSGLAFVRLQGQEACRAETLRGEEPQPVAEPLDPVPCLAQDIPGCWHCG